MNRIDARFSALREQGRKALIPFITAGDPHPDETVRLMHSLVAGGADVIELGVPFSDPMADGPVIQRASERALVHHTSLRDVLDMVRETLPELRAPTPALSRDHDDHRRLLGLCQKRHRRPARTAVQIGRVRPVPLFVRPPSRGDKTSEAHEIPKRGYPSVSSTGARPLHSALLGAGDSRGAR